MDIDVQRWRREFPIVDTCTYLVSHSLGAMPRRTAEYLQKFADQWSSRGVQAWYEGWWEIGRETGNILAPILGIEQNSISMHQNVTVAQGIIGSCFTYDGPRRRIVMTELEFPSNHYLFEGFRRYGAEVVYVPSADPIRLDLQRFLDAIDERTVLVPISLVLFKSAFITDVKAIIDKAHRVGALVVVDAYQAAGTVPMDLGGWNADFAVGGSVKWLCGGPGAGYLYVRPDLAKTLRPAFVGWAAHESPFAFATGEILYHDAPERFQSGTPNVPSLFSARAGYEIVASIGVPAIRRRSLQLTRRLIDGALAAGFRLHTPADDRERGGSVVIDVGVTRDKGVRHDGQQIADELIRRGVIIDYRPGAGIRVAPHFYNTEEDIDRAIATLTELCQSAV